MEEKIKYTLLELTQLVLRSIKGETVNSIDETEESLMVAEIVREAYLDIIASADLPEHKTIFELNASTDPAKPVLMTIPSDVVGLEWIEYDKATEDNTEPNYLPITRMELRDFRRMVNNLNTTETNVDTMTITTGSADSITFKYRNDKAPDYFCVLDDNQIIFDSFNEAIETTLMKNKTSCGGLKEPAWESNNTFVPNLDSQQFNLLVQEAKALAWIELRQLPHEKAERKARRNWVLLEKKKDRANYGAENYYSKLPDYGRRPV